MQAMSKKKVGRPRREPTVPVQIKLSQAMVDALQRLADRNHRVRTLELTLILEEKLRAEGLWPPPEAAQ